MFVETVSNRPGSFVSIIPSGVIITLQYDKNGDLEKIYRGARPNCTDTGDAVFTLFKLAKTIPLHINVLQGTTYVIGALYTDAICNKDNIVMIDNEDLLMAEYQVSPDKFVFWAGYADSLATSFQGPYAVRQWLRTNGFNILPGWVVPANLSQNEFNHIVSNEPSTLRYPLNKGYIVYRDNKFNVDPSDVRIKVVNKLSRSTDASGCLIGTLSYTDGTDQKFQYADIVKFNAQPGMLVGIDSNDRLVYSACTKNKLPDPLSSTVSCSTCGKIIKLPESGFAQCADPHCISLLYPHIVHLTNVLNLPAMSYDDFCKYVENKKLIAIQDIFTLPEYADIHVDCRLDTILHAAVPPEVCPRLDMFSSITNKCNNNLATINYYLHNPNTIENDLNIHSPFLHKFVSWISDPYNLLTVQALFSYHNIEIRTWDMRFEGPPIFRNKVIMVTGTFDHGEYCDIEAILQSYSATVVFEFSTKVDCILVGNHKDNIDGSAIVAARKFSIPVIDEKQFFSMYDIDADLSANGAN